MLRRARAQALKCLASVSSVEACCCPPSPSFAMANASAKRTGTALMSYPLTVHLADSVFHPPAQQNAMTIKNLRLGLLVSCALSLFLRLFFRPAALRPTTLAFWVYVLSLVPSVFLSRYLERIGSPRRDPTTGALISAGEDLSRPGVVEWCFDVVYITWACQIGSGAFGTWIWWLYLIVSCHSARSLLLQCQ